MATDEKKDPIPALNASAMLAGALTLTAALAWNEAAKTGIAALVPGADGTFGPTLAYAVVVTILVVIVLGIARAVRNNFDNIKTAFTAPKARAAGPAPKEGLITHRVWMQHCH